MIIEKLTNEQFALYIAMNKCESNESSYVIEKAEKYYQWLQTKNENDREQLKKKQ